MFMKNLSVFQTRLLNQKTHTHVRIRAFRIRADTKENGKDELEKGWCIFGFSAKKTAFYSISDTTSCTSGIILRNIPSMPDFKVTVEEGQPLQDPCRMTVTVPW